MQTGRYRQKRHWSIRPLPFYNDLKLYNYFYLFSLLHREYCLRRTDNPTDGSLVQEHDCSSLVIA